MSKTAFEYGKEACDALMYRYLPSDLPPEGAFFYHQGVFLSGMERIYKICGDKKYFNYIKEYVDSVIGENGEVIRMRSLAGMPIISSMNGSLPCREIQGQRSFPTTRVRRDIITYITAGQEISDVIAERIFAPRIPR